MERVEIELSAGQRELIAEKIASGDYPDLESYVAEVLRRDTQRLAQEKLEFLLLEGLNSGPGIPWDEAMRELRDRIRSRA